MQLRSWELRPPSAALERRIFNKRAPRSPAGVALRWLVPAAACAFLLLAVFNQESGLSTGGAPGEPMVAMIRSNLSPVASFSNNPARTTGSFTTAGFEWTNRSDSTSSIGSFLPAK